MVKSAGGYYVKKLLLAFLAVFSAVIIYQIVRKLLGGSWDTEMVILTLVSGNAAATLMMMSELGKFRGEMHKTIGELKLEIREIKYETQVGLHNLEVKTEAGLHKLEVKSQTGLQKLEVKIDHLSPKAGR